MVKKQQQNLQKNKIHKTLREKLRKKRQQQKKHKKQKSKKHKHHTSSPTNHHHHSKSNKNPKTKSSQIPINYHKLNKYIQKFIDIYEDNLQDFYQLFTLLDQGHVVDVGSVVNHNIQKIIIKIFKSLPLIKNHHQYHKQKNHPIKLKPLIQQLLTKSIQTYLQNGTQNSNQSSNQLPKKSHQSSTIKIQKQQINQPQINKQQQSIIKTNLQHQQIHIYSNMKLYPQKYQQNKPNQNNCIGPMITPDQRQQLSKLFDQQKRPPSINQSQHQQFNNTQQQNKQFQKIFSISYSSSRQTNPKKQKLNQIPQQLLAQGSGKIGYNQQIIIDPQQQQPPKKLIDQYRQMRKLNKSTQNSNRPAHRPFNRQKDIVYGRQRQFINNGVFFDFKSRMTKPKYSSSYL